MRGCWLHVPPEGRAGVLSATPGEVTSGAPVIGRSHHPSHTLAGPSPAFSNPKAIGNKPGTGNKGGVRLGWGEGLEAQSKILGLNSHPDQLCLFWAGHPPPVAPRVGERCTRFLRLSLLRTSQGMSWDWGWRHWWCTGMTGKR